MRDFRKLQQDPPSGVNGSPTSDNILRWNAVIFGPEDTPWDGGEERRRDSGFWNCALTSRHALSPPTPLSVPCRHVQADPGIYGGVPQPPPRRQVCLPNVPPQRLRGRRDLPGHPPKPVEPDLRRGGRADVHPGTTRETRLGRGGSNEAKQARASQPPPLSALRSLSPSSFLFIPVSLSLVLHSSLSSRTPTPTRPPTRRPPACTVRTGGSTTGG